MDLDDESDDETQLRDLQQLTAVLEADVGDPCGSACSSQYSIPTNNSEPVETPETQDSLDKIQSALALNKLYDEKMGRLEKILVSRLNQCRQKLSEISLAHSSNNSVAKQNSFRYLICGKPYFKDKDGFPAPENDDVIMMTKSGMYDFMDRFPVPGWTVKDKSQFLKEIVKMSKDLKKKEINSKIAQLKRDRKTKKSREIDKKIASFTMELEMINKMTLSEQLVLPLDQEYDWDEISINLNRRHAPQEYRSLWKVFLHPSINKKSWGKGEHSKLQELVHRNRLQNWDKIAEELGTGRTGYQCFVYYRTNMGNTFTGQKWTKEEEEYLRRLIDYYREDDYIPWGKVAASMENRTKIQLYNKYLRQLEYRKGRFLPEEDAVLLTCVENFGDNFKKISKYLPGRSAAQLRTRYHVLKNTTRTSAVWTVDEDKKLVQLMANQDSSFINYAALTEFFPDKDRIQLRARYVTLVKWMKRHPNKDLSKAPRRGARRLGHGQRSQDLDKALESLRNRIQTEVENKKSQRISINSPEDVIEHTIITTLINENIEEERLRKLHMSEKDQESQVINMTDIVTTTNESNLRKVLVLLKAKLNKNKFESSKYFQDYPGLAVANIETTSAKLKSYSKKEKRPKRILKPITSDSPDIWGHNTLTTSEYVLPPNYATITGCRKLMALVSSNPSPDHRTYSMNQLLKRNVIFKEQITLFMERFNTLFTWPMLLSNEGPKTDAESPSKRYSRHANSEKIYTVPTSVAIPSKSNEIIDSDGILDFDYSKYEEVPLVVKSYVGNEDFLYMDGMDSVEELEDESENED